MPLNLTAKDLLFLIGIPTAADIASSVIQSRGANRAADAQIASTERAAEISADTSRQAMDLQRDLYNDSVNRAMPWYDTGKAALGKLSRLSGLSVQPSAPSAVGGAPASGRVA